MSTTSWLIGILPLLAFAIMDSFFGLKAGLLAALLLALVECIWTWISFGELDQVSVISLILIVAMGVLAWKKNSSLLFKLQPSIISMFMAIWLITSWILDEALFVAMALKYAALLPIEVQFSLKNPQYLATLRLATLTTGVGLSLHSIATALAAMYLSNWWWIAVRGIGFYAFCIGGMIAARVIIQ